MKKIFLILLGIAATINAMAVDYTASAMVRVTSNTGYYSDFYYSESASLGALNGSTMNFEGRNVALYALNGTAKLQIIEGADLEGVQLGLMTDNGTDYTFNVSYVEGTNPLYLMDSETGVNYLLDGTSFTIENLPTNSTIENRFTLGRPAAPVYDAQVTTNEDGWASFSYAGNLAPVDASAQTLYKGAINGNVLDLYAVDYVKEDQGVLVKGTANTTYYFAAGSGSSDFAGNDLKPASAWESHTGTIFCLKGDALYEYTGSDMPANKAYLEISGSSAPKRISLRFNEEQGIEDIKADVKAEKFVENGQIFIKRGEAVYNMQGQIVK